ncbi:MAG: hypothetical protein IJ141_00455 [Lachnospiraceae bacterium]|nr:hypothetical protein [Lachnospiraceae bacterium]
MHNEVYVKSTDTFGDLTLTNDYFVIKGKHYSIRDWYIGKSQDNIAIPTKDILNIDFITMKSKRLFVCYIVIMTVLVAFIKILIRFTVGIPVIIILLCCVCSSTVIILYHMKAYKLFRVIAKGITVAVDVKNYDQVQLANLIVFWNNIRCTN